MTPNYLTRKKVLMGRDYTIDVPLDQYGGAIVRVHAIPDLELARIEQRTNFSMAAAWDVLTRNLSKEDLQALDEMEGKDIKPDQLDEQKRSLIGKTTQAMTPELTLYLGELCKAAILPPPDCACGGKGCEECDVTGIVESFVGFSVVRVGMAAMMASSTSWKDVEDFFSARKASSGAASPEPGRAGEKSKS